MAHSGSTLTMKFSPNRQYIASTGEDRIMGVCQATEAEQSDLFHFLALDPPFVYFTVNYFSELIPLYVGKEKRGKF